MDVYLLILNKALALNDACRQTSLLRGKKDNLRRVFHHAIVFEPITYCVNILSDEEHYHWSCTKFKDRLKTCTF